MSKRVYAVTKAVITLSLGVVTMVGDVGVGVGAGAGAGVGATGAGATTTGVTGVTGGTGAATSAGTVVVAVLASALRCLHLELHQASAGVAVAKRMTASNAIPRIDLLFIDSKRTIHILKKDLFYTHVTQILCRP